MYEQKFISMLEVDITNCVLKDENKLYEFFNYFFSIELKRNLQTRIKDSYLYKVFIYFTY